jgi:aromatic-L-amino-acid decarboxylase
MASMLAQAGRRVAEFITALPLQPAQASDANARIMARLKESPPEHGIPFPEILDLLFRDVVPCAFNTAGPGYLAYVPGGGLYAAAIAEFLASTVNRYAGVWAAAPAVVELETQVLRWLAELLGFPQGTLGVFTTGGSLSNLVAIVAARAKYLGDDLLKGTVYFSTEVHHSLIKAARVAGIREGNLREIPVDGGLRIRVDELADQVAQDRRRGNLPFFVCGSAGTVNTGTVDPLPQLADLAAQENLWLHVDGAYGAIFRLVDELKPVLAGMERADSLAVDPHKGLFLPYGTGVLLVRDMTALRQAYRSPASYMPVFQEGGERIDFCEVSPELSRAWRGLRVWLPFKLYGVGAFRRALQEKRDLAVLAYERLRTEPDIEIAAPPELTLFAFRQRFPNASPEEENRRNQALLERINASRRIMLTGTVVAGTYYCRLCVLHLRTHRARIEEALEIIHRALLEGRSDHHA